MLDLNTFIPNKAYISNLSILNGVPVVYFKDQNLSIGIGAKQNKLNQSKWNNSLKSTTKLSKVIVQRFLVYDTTCDMSAMAWVGLVNYLLLITAQLANIMKSKTETNVFKGTSGTVLHRLLGCGSFVSLTQYLNPVKFDSI